MWFWYVDVVELIFGIISGLLKILFCFALAAGIVYWYNLGCPLPDLPF